MVKLKNRTNINYNHCFLLLFFPNYLMHIVYQNYTKQRNFIRLTDDEILKA